MSTEKGILMSTEKVLDIEGKKISEVLSQQYAVDYYQREYKWGKQQMVDLLEDLYHTFLREYDLRAHTLEPPFETSDYPHYFLGTYVISNNAGKSYIVDGQQRLTSLTLLLIYLSNVEPRKDLFDIGLDITGLISSRRNGGPEVFNISVEDHIPDFKALRKGDTSRESRLSSRYKDIEEFFGNVFQEDPTQFYYFVYWLRDHVRLAEIKTYSTIEAYTIFETMNDRGMSLSQSEMLKGWVLSHIVDDKRVQAVEVWNRMIKTLSEGFKGSDDIQANIDRFFSDVIRAKFIPLDDWGRDVTEHNKIWSQSSSYYRWLKNPERSLNIKSPSDFWDLLLDFEYYSKWFAKIDSLSNMDSPETINLWYLSYSDTDRSRAIRSLKSVFLSGVPHRDKGIPDTEIIQTMNVVARFLDTIMIKQFWSKASVSLAPTHQLYYVKAFRDRSLESICYSAYQYLAENDAFEEQPNPALIRDTRKVKTLLLRLTDYVHEITQEGSSPMRAKTKYDVEHILSVHSDNHEFFDTVEDFEEWRNRLGALLVLPSSKNSSYGKMPYKEKIIKYASDNRVAALLSPELYEKEGKIAKNNPGLVRLMREHDLELRTYDKFGKEAIRERNAFYADLARSIWDENWFIEQAGFAQDGLSFHEYIEILDDEIGRKSVIQYQEAEIVVKKNSRMERAQKAFNALSHSNEQPVSLSYVYKKKNFSDISLRGDGRFYYKEKAYEAPGTAINALHKDNDIPATSKNAWDALKALYHGKELSLNEIEKIT